MLLLLMTLVGWIIDRIQEKKAWHPPAPEPVRDPGCRINHDLWEKHKGCNPTGKYNDIW